MLELITQHYTPPPPPRPLPPPPTSPPPPTQNNNTLDSVVGCGRCETSEFIPIKCPQEILRMFRFATCTENHASQSLRHVTTASNSLYTTLSQPCGTFRIPCCRPGRPPRSTNKSTPPITHKFHFMFICLCIYHVALCFPKV